MRPPLDCASALTTISSTFTWSGRVSAKSDAVGDVLGRHRLDALVDGARLLLVALEADEREVGLDQAGRERGDPDRPAEQVLAQRLAELATADLTAQ